MKVYLHMYNGNVQQNSLCVESCVIKKLPISPRFSPTVFYRDASSVLLQAHLCTAVDYAQNPVSGIVHPESVKICTTGMSSRTLYAQHPVSLRIFPSILASRLRFFIAMQIQYSYEHNYVQQYALCAKSCVRNWSSRERESLFYTACYENQYRIDE